MAYEREAQTDIAELQRLAAGRVETDPPSGYEREAQTDVVELGRLARDLAESDPGLGGYERVGQTNIAVLRRKLLGGVVVPPVATALTLSGPSGGNVGTASSPFTVALSPVGGTVVGTVTITPNDGGGGGSFTPTTVGLTTVAPSAAFTYTPASAGAKTISATNDKGLTNPGSLSYAAASGGLADGDPVSLWKDSSIGGHDATQTGTARPIFKTNIVNGKPVVRFTVAGLSTLNLSLPVSSVSPFTVLAVLKPANSGSPFVTLGTTAANSPFEFQFSGSNAYCANRTGYGVFAALGTPSAAFHVVSFKDADVTVSAAYLDGAQIFGSFAPLVNNVDFNVIGLQGPIVSATYSDGDLAELLFYNVLISDPNRQNLEKYLGTKYGITVAGGSAVQPDTVAGLVGWWKADSLL